MNLNEIKKYTFKKILNSQLEQAARGKKLSYIFL